MAEIPEDLKVLYTDARIAKKGYWRVDPQEVADMIERIAKLEARLEALEWTPISEENPAVDGDEIGSYFDPETFGVTEYLAGSAKDLLQDGWTHRRPINPPRDPSQEVKRKPTTSFEEDEGAGDS